MSFFLSRSLFYLLGARKDGTYSSQCLQLHVGGFFLFFFLFVFFSPSQRVNTHLGARREEVIQAGFLGGFFPPVSPQMLHCFLTSSFYHIKTNVIIEAGRRATWFACLQQTARVCLVFSLLPFYCWFSVCSTELVSTEGVFFFALYLSLVRGASPWLPRPISCQFRAPSFEPLKVSPRIRGSSRMNQTDGIQRIG